MAGDDPLAEIRAGIAARLEEQRLLLAGDEQQIAKERERLVQISTDFLIKRGTRPSHALVIAVRTVRTVRIPMPMREAHEMMLTLIREAGLVLRKK